nr:hypothetical protein HK105_002211 [Polyrhizophydium stewartii]
MPLKSDEAVPKLLRLEAAGENCAMNEYPRREIIGKLLPLSAFRVDVAHAVGVLGTLNANQGDLALGRSGLTIVPPSLRNLAVYAGSDMANCPGMRRPVDGSLIKLGKATICVLSCKQSLVALSTNEADPSTALEINMERNKIEPDILALSEARPWFHAEMIAPQCEPNQHFQTLDDEFPRDTDELGDKQHKIDHSETAKDCTTPSGE